MDILCKAVALLGALVAGVSLAAGLPEGMLARDAHQPAAPSQSDAIESAELALGRSVFEVQWLPSGTPGSPEHVGLGPLFNAASCNTCHVGGAHGLGPTGDGLVPVALVIKLESPTATAGEEPQGDPHYGRVLNTQAVEPAQAEGTVSVRYSEVSGYYYPFGARWSIRVPHYHVELLGKGRLAPSTIISPRLAPALFGLGLLEAVPETDVTSSIASSGVKYVGAPSWRDREGQRRLGRFGWQAQGISIRDQTALAFALEMGLTSPERADDDCTAMELHCQESDSTSPEVSEELLSAVVKYVQHLPVPDAHSAATAPERGAILFRQLGCATCHRPQLRMAVSAGDGTQGFASIAPYTDLRLHDLGSEMADETALGTKVPSRWRTAPLWGLGYRMQQESFPTFLHDGRATTLEEAILWHFGEAGQARYRFMKLLPSARESLLRWLATL